MGLVVLAAVAGYLTWPYWGGDPEVEVARLAALLQLQPGMSAAEVGAGGGKMSVILARKLGPQGRVLATEMEEEQRSKIQKAAGDAGVATLQVLAAGEKSTNLPAGCCDAVYLRKVYHHVTDPVSVNASLFEAVRPGGRLAVIDFAPRSWMFWLQRPQGVPENRGGHGIPPALLIEEMTSAGFVFESRHDDWAERNYCVVFRKP